jgi:hypothetical protein
MSQNRSYDLKRAINSCLEPDVGTEPSIPREWVEAIVQESSKTSSYEIGFALIEAFQNKTSIMNMAQRIATLYRHARASVLDSTHIMKQFDKKMYAILNDVCKEIVDDLKSAEVALNVVYIFYKTVYTYESSASNALIDMLSTVAIPPENNGHKKLNTVMKKTRNHHMVSAAIQKGGFDINLVNEAFSKSPSLHILFITQFKEEDNANRVPVADSIAMRKLLGLDEREYNDIDSTKGCSLIEEIPELDTFMDSILADGAIEQPVIQKDENLSTYESPCGKKRIPEEAETPPRKKPCVVAQLVQNVQEIRQNDRIPTQPIINLTEIAYKNNSITSYFKIKRGRVTEQKHKKITDPITEMLYCDESLDMCD